MVEGSLQNGFEMYFEKKNQNHCVAVILQNLFVEITSDSQDFL